MRPAHVVACFSMPGGVGAVAGTIAGAMVGTHGAAKVVSGSQWVQVLYSVIGCVAYFFGGSLHCWF